jgi:hypothetical protein
MGSDSRPSFGSVYAEPAKKIDMSATIGSAPVLGEQGWPLPVLAAVELALEALLVAAALLAVEALVEPPPELAELDSPVLLVVELVDSPALLDAFVDIPLALDVAAPPCPELLFAPP